MVLIIHSSQVGTEVFFPAAGAQEVVRTPRAALSSEPAVHVGAITTVTTATGALPAARVVPLHVGVKVQRQSVTQLTLHHLTGLRVLLYSLRESDGERGRDEVRQRETKIDN